MRCPNCSTELPDTAKFCLECGRDLRDRAAFASPVSYTPKHLAERILTSRAALEGERKQVTVLFCDIVGSTPLAERVGPERMHALLNRLLRAGAGRGPPLRGHDQPVPRRRLHGAVRRAARPRGPRAAGGARGARASGARCATARSTLARRAAPSSKVRMGLNTGLVVVGAHRRQPAHGLHGGRRHHQRGGAAAAGLAPPGDILISRIHRAPGARRGAARCPPAASPSRARPSRSTAYKLLGLAPRRTRRRSAVGRAGVRTLRGPRRRAAPARRAAGRRPARPGPAGERDRPGRHAASRGCSTSSAARWAARTSRCSRRAAFRGAASVAYLPIIELVRAQCGVDDTDTPETVADQGAGDARRPRARRAEQGAPPAASARAQGRQTRWSELVPEVIRARTHRGAAPDSAVRGPPPSAARASPRGPALDRSGVGGVPRQADRAHRGRADLAGGDPPAGLAAALGRRRVHQRHHAGAARRGREPGADRRRGGSYAAARRRSCWRSSRRPTAIRCSWARWRARSSKEATAPPRSPCPTACAPCWARASTGWATRTSVCSRPPPCWVASSRSGCWKPCGRARARWPVTWPSWRVWTSSTSGRRRRGARLRVQSRAHPGSRLRASCSPGRARRCTRPRRWRWRRRRPGRVEGAGDQLAYHWTRTPRADKAVEALRRVAARAMAAYANTEALAALREAETHAARLTSDRERVLVELLLERSQTRFLLGQITDGLEELRPTPTWWRAWAIPR